MKVVMTELSKIKPYGKNPRKNEAAVKQVAESITAFGFQQPIVVDKKNVIIVGHTRFFAAQELKLKQVPVVFAVDLPPKKVKAYRIADNKVAEVSQWDEDLLKLELDKLDGVFTGFSEAELDSMFFGFDSGSSSNSSGSGDATGLEENEVSLTFMFTQADRDAVVEKLNDVKRKNSLETLSEALLEIVTNV